MTTTAMTTWPHVHVEMVGPGRTLLLKREGPWLLDQEERFPPPLDLAARVQIGDFTEVGRGLVIDGTVQLTESVDALYTTALVFPAALCAASRARWLIVGGGDGATPREALRFRDAQAVRVVDISRLVVEQTQALIPSFWDGCQHDPRLRIEIRDAGAALREMAAAGEQVDVLVYDLSDPGNEEVNPYAESSADALYTEEAFRLAARCLRPGGVFVAQLAELSLLRYEDHLRHRKALQRAFRHVTSYRTPIEPFGYWESFVLASNQAGPWMPAQVDVEETLARLYRGDLRQVYSAAWHQQLFLLHPALQQRIDSMRQALPAPLLAEARGGDDADLGLDQHREDSSSSPGYQGEARR